MAFTSAGAEVFLCLQTYREAIMSGIESKYAILAKNATKHREEVELLKTISVYQVYFMAQKHIQLTNQNWITEVCN